MQKPGNLGIKEVQAMLRVVGETAELWYDASEHLVREKLVEDGHTLVLELTNIR